jgi:hypothetical protein
MLDEGRKRVIGIMAAICPALRSRITSVYAGKNMAERVGFEPRLSNEINKLGGANGIFKPPKLYQSNQLHILLDAYWTLISSGVMSSISRCR